MIRKKAGKVVLTSTNVLSPDGKTMTITTTGHSGAGQAVHNVRVYQRQTQISSHTRRIEWLPRVEDLELKHARS